MEARKKSKRKLVLTEDQHQDISRFSNGLTTEIFRAEMLHRLNLDEDSLVNLAHSCRFFQFSLYPQYTSIMNKHLRQLLDNGVKS